MIKYLFSMKRKLYAIEIRRQQTVAVVFFLLIKIVCRGNKSLCCLLSMKYAMRISSFVPRYIWFVHAMGLNSFQQSTRTLFTWQDCSSKNGIELLYLTKYNVTVNLNNNLVIGHASMSHRMSHGSPIHFVGFH